MNGHANDASGNMSTLRLLQLCSPAFPVGAFAYSQGLEQAIERQWIDDSESLREWLRGVLLHNLALTDLALLHRSIALWQRLGSRTQDAETPQALSRLILSYRETSELRNEEQYLGRALARVLTHLGVAEAEPFVEEPNCSYILMFGLAAERWQVPALDAVGGFAYSWLENQVSAASRLMRLGQLAAQQLITSLLESVLEAGQVASLVTLEDIGYNAPGFTLASTGHEEQYSRLFRS